jgi:Tol biopolymer transport system component
MRRPSAGVLALAAAAIIALAGCGASDPEPGLIVYTAVPEATSQINVMEADGTGQRVLLEPDEGYYAASWSPDGGRIVFERGLDCEDVCSQICTADADGTSRRCLTSPIERSEAPAWSPDGELIVFLRWKRDDDASTDIQTDLFLIRPDGTEERQLTSKPGEVSGAAWSPDGERIIVSADWHERGSPADLYVINADGSEPQRLITTPGSAEYSPESSPDGEKIVFVRTAADDSLFDVWVMNADGTEAVMLARDASAATWSPDGGQLALTCLDKATGSDELCLMNSDGTNRRIVTHYAAGIGGVIGPDWAPRR